MRPERNRAQSKPGDGDANQQGSEVENVREVHEVYRMLYRLMSRESRSCCVGN